MKKVLKNVFKWIVLVWISFSLVFTMISSLELGGIIDAIVYKVETIQEPIIYSLETSNIEEYCKHYQEMADEALKVDEEEAKEAKKGNEIAKRNVEVRNLYKKYPAGVSMLFRDIVVSENLCQIYIVSLMMGISIGTAVYLFFNKDKNGLKFVVAIYILFIFILGFVEGIGSVSGRNITILDIWMFPETYIIPVTTAFGIVIIKRIMQQNNINKKQKEKVEKNNEDNKEENK